MPKSGETGARYACYVLSEYGVLKVDRAPHLTTVYFALAGPCKLLELVHSDLPSGP
jgi:hypothetical protein